MPIVVALKINGYVDRWEQARVTHSMEARLRERRGRDARVLQPVVR
jgi:hypothetical protein